jgi:hypothetical protein
MKILLDEQLPVKLKYRFQPEFKISTVRDEHWLGIKNGALLLLAYNSGFTVFITNDQSLACQQKLIQFEILFININQPSNRCHDILSVLLKIKEWRLKNNNNNEPDLIIEKNYPLFPDDFTN